MSVKILTQHLSVPDIHRIEVWMEHGGYEAVRETLGKVAPEEVIEQVKRSGLRGRGGAAFPTGLKWSFVPKGTGKPVYLAVNADEGEPGTCKDRLLMLRTPHQVIEGIILSAYAIGSHLAFVYIRGEYLEPYEVMERAVAEAYQHGFLGRNILGSGYDLDIVLHRGAGAYICGEETALLSSLEGDRGEPREKPPFPAVEGLYRCPTIINNVETLCNVPHILKNGPEWYASIGTEKSTGTRLFSVSGHVNRPGVYELELGTPFKVLLNDYAGGIRGGRKMKALIPGGSSMPMLPAEIAWEINTDMESIQAAGSMAGSGGVIVMDETTSIPHVVHRLTKFYAHESCGKCIPCREGMMWMVQILEKIISGRGTPADIDKLDSVAANIEGRSFCLLGDSGAWPVRSSIKHFRHEYEALVSKGARQVA